MFGHIVHCDWSARQQGRWLAEAWREGTRWRARGPRPVGTMDAELDRLFALAAAVPVLAAFDFPIGLPSHYAERTGFADFASALEGFGRADWATFYRAAATPEEIGLTRPFFPAAPGAARLQHLLEGHGVADVGALMRRCERGGAGSRAAGCMFWTLGAKQVGKAAIHGWQFVVGPALRRGARLWPFDGPLRATAPGLTLAESYPGDVYRRLGLAVRSKGDPAVLRAVAPTLFSWTARARSCSVRTSRRRYGAASRLRTAAATASMPWWVSSAPSQSRMANAPRATRRTKCPPPARYGAGRDGSWGATPRRCLKPGAARIRPAPQALVRIKAVNPARRPGVAPHPWRNICASPRRSWPSRSVSRFRSRPAPHSRRRAPRARPRRLPTAPT